MSFLLDSFSKDRALENNLEFLQQIAQRRYIVHGEDHQGFYRLMTSLRVGNEVYQRLSGQRKIEDYKAQCVANISAFIQNNPNASNNALKKEVENQVALFAIKVQSM